MPQALREQLAVGGHLVIPVGPRQDEQKLVRITRVTEGNFTEEVLDNVRFVPLIGEQGWADQPRVLRGRGRGSPGAPVAQLVREAAEPVLDVGTSVDALLERIADARVVLLGRGHARDQRVLPDAGAHHAPHRAARLPVRGGRGRLAGRGADRRARAGRAAALLARVHPVRALPGLDVAQRGGARLRGVAARVQRRPARARAAGGVPASTSTACSRQSPPCSTTSTAWTRRPVGWRGSGTGC